MTLQIEDILTPKKLKQLIQKLKDLKLKLKKIEKLKLKDFKISAVFKINPINIQINDSEIQNKLLFYAKRCKCRFIANSLLFILSIKKDTNVIFITRNGLNDAKNILINGKLCQGIGVN